MSRPIAVFGYGSLVSAASAARTLGRPPRDVWAEGEAVPARLVGWRRRFSQARDNRECEKTFALDSDDSIPDWVLGLNVERTGDRADAVNGLLVAVEEVELARLDVRELRYDRVDIGDSIQPPDAAHGFDSVATYVAKPERLALTPPEGAVILRTYAEAVEEAFGGLGQLDEYRRTTGPYPAPLVEAHLVTDRIPEGNPRAW